MIKRAVAANQYPALGDKSHARWFNGLIAYTLYASPVALFLVSLKVCGSELRSGKSHGLGKP